MEELHATGGVPPGWQFTPPPGDAEAGREAFVEFGCYKCHRVAGENFPSGPTSEEFVGPDLTGMGSHHPPGYFAEAILNPNAIRVDGPGYLSEDGASKMPEYPQMTLEQLSDLVAYLASLKEPTSTESGGSGAGHAHHAYHEHHGSHVESGAVGSAPAPERLSYLAQAFEVEDERIEEFYRWFDAREFERVPGLVSIATYASRERKQGRHTVLVLFGFENDAALEAFRRQRDAMAPGPFPRPVESFFFEPPPLYFAVQMSRP